MLLHLDGVTGTIPTMPQQNPLFDGLIDESKAELRLQRRIITALKDADRDTARAALRRVLEHLEPADVQAPADKAQSVT